MAHVRPHITMLDIEPLDTYPYALCVYHQGQAYYVGQKYPNQAPKALADAQFLTYEAALVRLRQEREAH